MGSYTPNRNLYKPDIGEVGWGYKVNQNWDILDAHGHERADISDFFSAPFWDNIPDKPSTFPPESHTHEIVDIIGLQDKLTAHDTQISRIKTEILTIALNVMMNKAILSAETKDFYSIIADVTTPEYPHGFKNTFETLPTGVTFDNDGGGVWIKAIKIPLITIPVEHAQYKIVIQSNTMQIYAADGTLKAEYGAETGVASDFWSSVKSDGNDIRVADENYSQLYFWVESFDYANKQAVIWVRIEADTSELYIAYGNPDALPSAYNDPTQVFEFFDDFEDGDYTDKWVLDNPEGGFAVTEAEGVLKITATQAGALFVKDFTSSNDNPIIVEYKWKPVKGDSQPLTGIVWHSADVADWINLGFYRAYVFEDNFKIRYIDEDLAITPYTVTLGEWVKVTLKIKGNGQFEVCLGTTCLNAQDTRKTSGMLGLGGKGWSETEIEAHYDDFRIYKLADPAEFGEAETITLITTGDFLTVTFDFPDGVDKLLITVDTDATAIYYSTDDGATWNPIQPDTETLLPSTAYSIKWKFEFASYVRGYAFITW